MDVLSSPVAMRRWAMASLLANMGIVLTGGLVRVTASGLGCPTWPQCTADSYVPHADAAGHAFIEFGNRLLTFVLVAIAVGTLIAAWRARDDTGAPRRDLRGLALVAALGIPAQAIIGGISVRTNLNPWVVGLHLVASIALIVICTVLVHTTWQIAPVPLGRIPRVLVIVTSVIGIVAMLLGMVVTGAGPNSGDGGAARNGLDLTTFARMHSLSVWLVIACTIALLVLLRRNRRARRAVVLLLAVELVQGMIGYAQYALALPAGLVALHMAGTTCFTLALTHLWWLTRTAAGPQRPR